MGFTTISYYIGGELNPNILKGGKVIIFTPQVYSSTLQELTKGHPDMVIVNYNIEFTFTKLIEEYEKISVDYHSAIETIERILYPHYVSVATNSTDSMTPDDIIVFLENTTSNIDISEKISMDLIGDTKIYINNLKEYDDTFMDTIIRDKKGKDYIDGSIIIAHRDLWDVLMGNLSILEHRVRVLGLHPTLEDLLLIFRENNKNMFESIPWK